MQGQKNSIDSFREAVDIGQQGSDSGTSGMNNNSQQTSLNNLIPPMERRWSSFAPPGEAYLNPSSSSGEAQSFAASSESGGSSSHHSVGTMTKEILFPARAMVGLSGHQMRNGASSSNHIHQGMDLNEGCPETNVNGEQDIGSSNLASTLYLSSRLGLEREPTSGAGSSSGNSGCVLDGSDGSSGSLGNWGLSCKRKAFEGTSGQSCAGAGSSSSLTQPESCVWHNGSTRYNNPSSTLCLSGSSSGTSSEPQNSRIASDSFPSSANVGNSVRLSVNESNPASHLESMPFNLASASSGSGSRRLSLRQAAAAFNDSLDLRSAPSTGTTTEVDAPPQNHQPQMTYVSGFAQRNHTIPWHEASSSRSGIVPHPFPFGDRGLEVPRANTELPMFVSASEMRNSAHDPTSSNITASLGIPSSTRIPSSSSGSPFPNPAWVQPHNSSGQNRQRTLEFAPWSLFPSADALPPGSGGRSSHPDPLPPGPSSSRDTPMSSSGVRSSHTRQQPYHRSAFLADRQGEDALNISNSLRALSADADGRRRLISEIRQVLHAMRRGEALQIEDYMLFDPFMYHGMAEMHDRHRDMRLDVDNMSYEELLALEERIGDVSTGLTEEAIFKLMKHRKHHAFSAQPRPDSEPCCICQEEFVDGDDVGVLDCGHDFHSDCVKQWLTQKNLCPICKTTGLLT